MSTYRNSLISIGMFLFFICTSTYSDVSALDPIIANLTGSDDAARMTARQLLPRYGIPAIQKLIPLLKESNPTGKAARDTLFDTAAALCAPGRDKERQQAIVTLAELVSPHQPQFIQVIGLEILAFTIPSDGDVRPVASLLADSELFDKARSALERIGSDNARTALRSALDTATPEQQCALLDSLGELKDTESQETIANFVKNDRAEIRLAAIRAIAKIGLFQSAPIIFPPLDRFLHDPATPPSQKIQAIDAGLRYAHAMEEISTTHLEARNLACHIYGRTLGMESGAYLSAALAGLGRSGTEVFVPQVIRLLNHSDLRTRQSAANALKVMKGEPVTDRLIAEFPAQDKEIQYRLLSVFGARKSSKTFPILNAAAQSDDLEYRKKALAALGDTAQSDACEILISFCKQNTEEGQIARDALLRLAGELKDKGENISAGLAFNSVLQSSTDKKPCFLALEGITACPTAEAIDSVLRVADLPEYKTAVIPALVSLTSVHSNTDTMNQSARLIQKLQSLQPPFDFLMQAIQQVKKINPSFESALLLGFVTHWKIIGPFPMEGDRGWDMNFIQEPNIELHSTYTVGNQKREWKNVTSKEDNGKIDLLKELGTWEQSVGYAYTEITVENETDAILKLGVDDGEKIWLNDELVFNHFVARPFQVDEDTVPVHLKAGINRILLKIYQNNMGWEFCLHITTPDGHAFPFFPMQ